MKSVLNKILMVIFVALIFNSNKLYSEESQGLPDSVIYHKIYDEIFIGYGPDLKNQDNEFLMISNLRSRKITNLLYFTMEEDIIGSLKSEDRYFGVSICPGVSLIKYFGDSFRIYESTTFGLSYLSINNTHKWSNFGYCAGIRFGIGYWRLSLETALKYFGNEVALAPLTVGVKINTYGWF
ncbi:MAG: hypothetical protein V1779_09295 [bacterium]